MPRGLIGTETHVTADLQRANTILAGQHQMNDAEPLTQGLVGVLEDRPDQDREAIADIAWRAFIATPIEVLWMLMDIGVLATRTARAFRPSVLHQIFRAGRVIWEQALKVANRHLMNVQGVLRFFPHGLSPVEWGLYAMLEDTC